MSEQTLKREREMWGKEQKGEEVGLMARTDLAAVKSAHGSLLLVWVKKGHSNPKQI